MSDSPVRLDDMPEFTVRDTAIHSNRGCAFCMQYEGPFMDTGVDCEFGRISICLPTEKRAGCFGQMLWQLGYLSKEQLNQERDEAAEKIAELEKQLTELKKKLSSKTFEMTADELRQLIEA